MQSPRRSRSRSRSPRSLSPIQRRGYWNQERAHQARGRNIFPRSRGRGGGPGPKRGFIQLPPMSMEEQITLDAVALTQTSGRPILPTPDKRNRLRYKLYFSIEAEPEKVVRGECLFCRRAFTDDTARELHLLSDHSLIYEAYKEAKRNHWYEGASVSGSSAAPQQHQNYSRS